MNVKRLVTILIVLILLTAVVIEEQLVDPNGEGPATGVLNDAYQLLCEMGLDNLRPAPVQAPLEGSPTSIVLRTD